MPCQLAGQPLGDQSGDAPGDRQTQIPIEICHTTAAVSCRLLEVVLQAGWKASHDTVYSGAPPALTHYTITALGAIIPPAM